MTQLLENALAGTVLIAAVSLLRRLLKGYFPPETWLCLFRLLSPVVPQSVLSVYNLPRLLAGLSVAPEALTGAGLAGQAAASLSGPENAQAELGTLNSAGDASPTAILTAVYLIGAACVFLWFLWGWTQTFRQVRRAKPMERRDLGPSGPWRCASVRISAEANQTGPFTFGVLRPVILLTPGLSGQALHMALTHEGIHARRRDNLWHYVMAAALVVHWWNPAVWLMARLLRMDVEKSCDRAVLRFLGAEHKADYAKMLVAMSITGKDSVFSSSLGSKRAEERILFIMKLKKTSFTAIVLSLVLIFAVSVTMVTGCAYEEIPSETGEITIVEFGDETGVNEAVEVSVDGEFAVENEIEADEEEPGTSTDSVSVSKTGQTISVGSSYSKSFTMSNGTSDAHTAFKVTVKNATGSYKILISSSNGYSYASAEQTGNFSVTIKNAASDTTYTVYILNCSTSKITADITISSYYY
ncbi:MAG: M56 family metallopeptidase [Oscillospiraceae bacterium]|nr:M56 family metallopeptidase [Oscillospiraceae bacterium]